MLLLEHKRNQLAAFHVLYVKARMFHRVGVFNALFMYSGFRGMHNHKQCFLLTPPILISLCLLLCSECSPEQKQVLNAR